MGLRSSLNSPLIIGRGDEGRALFSSEMSSSHCKCRRDGADAKTKRRPLFFLNVGGIMKCLICARAAPSFIEREVTRNASSIFGELFLQIENIYVCTVPRVDF